MITKENLKDLLILLDFKKNLRKFLAKRLQTTSR